MVDSTQFKPNPLFPGKFFISTVLESLETKQQMSGPQLRRYLQRAGMAGGIIGIMYVVYYGLVGAFEQIPIGDSNLEQLGYVVGAAAFGWALVFIYYTKSELLTSNMMIVTVGAYHHAVGWYRSMRLLFFCYLGNLLGGVVIAALLASSTLLDGATMEAMLHGTEGKLAFIDEGAAGWLDLFVRAIFCNFMINLAMLIVYNGYVKDDLTKSLVMIASVFVFAFLAFQHSVANTVLFTIVGFTEGIDVGAATINVVICLIGNYIGGGLLIGWYYAYVNDEIRAARTLRQKEEKKREKKARKKQQRNG